MEEKEIKVFIMQNEQLDPDSIGISLDFDGVTNVPTIMGLIKTRLQAGNQVKIWDVIVVMWSIYAENKRRRRAKE